MPRPRLGAPAPAIEGIDAEGRRWSLAQGFGAPQVVIFHRHIH